LVPRRQQRRDFALDFSHHLPPIWPKPCRKWVEELSLAIGGLGIAASDPNVLYAATGEWTSGIGFPTDPVVTGVVGREFDVHPNQISTWKDQFIEDELRQQAGGDYTLSRKELQLWPLPTEAQMLPKGAGAQNPAQHLRRRSRRRTPLRRE
jgi:hypothetical protein